jgi:hypothetical protein
MIDNARLRTIRAELDGISGEELTVNHQYCFDLVEERAISILDSQHTDFTPGLLQEYLMSYLYLRQMEYGLIDFPDPEES